MEAITSPAGFDESVLSHVAAGLALAVAPLAAPAPVAVSSSLEWKLEDALKEWPPMERPVQHVGVPGYQWQVGVYWDGALLFGQTLHRGELYHHPRVEEEIARASLGPNLMHVSFGYGETMRLPDRQGSARSPFDRGLEEGRLPIPHFRLQDEGILWDETVFAHLMDRPFSEALPPRPDDVLLTQARFSARNNGFIPRTAHLWIHFGDTSHTRSVTTQLPGLAPALDHTFDPPYGLLEGRVRYIIPAPSSGSLIWHDSARLSTGGQATRVVEWRVTLDPGEEASLRLVIPYGLLSPAQAASAASAPYTPLYKETCRYWKSLELGPGQIRTPEPFINDYLACVAAQMAEQTAYRRVARLWMYKTSPNWYEDYYPANAAVAMPVFDLRGMGSLSRAVLQSFIDFQSDDASVLLVNRTGGHVGALSGTEGLEGATFVRHPGFLGNFGPPVSAVPPGDPRQGWTANATPMCHGAMLYALAAHFRITRDNKWLGSGQPSPLEAMLAACDWLSAERNLTRRSKDGVKAADYGLLPPASAHDWLSGSAIFNDAWCIYGMAEAERLLREISHPRAAEIKRDLDDYRACLEDCYRRAAAKASPVQLPDGSSLPFIPRLTTELSCQTIDWTYISYGPLRAGALGALDPRGALVDAALAFAEHGKPKDGGVEALWRHYVEPETHWPLWSLFLERDDLPRFFELAFNTVAAGVHRDFRVGCEARDGVVSCAPGDAERWSMFRAMFVNERTEAEERQALWLMQAIPRSWLKPGMKASVREMGTRFGGAVDLGYVVAPDGSVSVDLRLHSLAVLPSQMVIRLRSGCGKPLASVTVNGACAEPGPQDTVQLPTCRDGRFHIVARF